jgi:hypothetical protein
MRRRVVEIKLDLIKTDSNRLDAFRIPIGLLAHVHLSIVSGAPVV